VALDPGGAVESVVDQGAVQTAIGAYYALERELGRGGMATVYLGRDLRHRRHVAIKVLSPELSAALGPERFLREIELTASLQHPHILPLFDSGSAAGLLYYVMPYVDGETLRARLERERQLPVDDAVRLAREVADALGYAHARGIIHRDIKPENILLQGGHALVTDFGIALAVRQAGGERLTRTGLSLGTPQYMAPEQAMGDKATDARTDVYALGAVTYEMLAGEPPFSAPSAQGIVAKMLTEEPAALTLRRPSVPPHVEVAVRMALEKLPADRFESTAAFAAALSDPALLHGRMTRGAAPRTARPGPIPPRLAATLAVGAIAVAALAWAVGRASGRASAAAGMTAGPPMRGAVRFTIDVDSGSLGVGAPAISPDGRTIVYALEGADGARLYARQIDDLVARPLAGTDDGRNPFFSPDGAWVAFYSRGALRKIRVAGGSAITVTEVPPSFEFTGGSWVGDTIVYGVYWYALYRVPASGGVASRVAVADTSMRLEDPHLLPGGRALLVTASPASATTGSRVAVLDLASGKLRRFGPGLAPRYVAGQIVYSTGAGELYRQPFDVGRLEPSGSAELIASGLAFVMGAGGAPPFDASQSGAVVYRAGGSASSGENSKLALLDRAGRELRVIRARRPWAPRFSPDGLRVAYGANAPGRDSSDVWVTDLESGATERLTTDANDSNDPQWSPDGKAIAYSANAADGEDLFIKGGGRGGSVRPLTRRPGYQFSNDWLRDGSAILFVDVPRTGELAGNQSIWVQPMDGSEARPYVATDAREFGARASPDGRWVAFHSDETGTDEVYVEPYPTPTPGRKTVVSNRGGVHPAWRRDGKELYYWQGDQLVAVHLEAGARDGPLVVRDRTLLFRAPYPGGVTAMYDVSPDGSRFIIAEGHQRANRLVVALNALSP
jgi:eukaryotic-like serine/threonine-protein kinase